MEKFEESIKELEKIVKTLKDNKINTENIIQDCKLQTGVAGILVLSLIHI